MSLDDKIYERELQMALEISAKENSQETKPESTESDLKDESTSQLKDDSDDQRSRDSNKSGDQEKDETEEAEKTDENENEKKEKATEHVNIKDDRDSSPEIPIVGRKPPQRKTTKRKKIGDGMLSLSPILLSSRMEGSYVHCNTALSYCEITLLRCHPYPRPVFLSPLCCVIA